MIGDLFKSVPAEEPDDYLTAEDRKLARWLWLLVAVVTIGWVVAMTRELWG